MPAQKVIVVTGLQGSGKTSFAKEWLAEAPTQRVRINYDDLRDELYGVGWKWNRVEEDHMKEAAQVRAEDAIQEGKDVIIDNTNLTRADRKSWMNLAKSFKAEYSEVEMDTPVADCVARDRLRSGKARVGRALIERNALFYGYIDWSDRNVYPRDFIIVDMDGTVADCDWRRKLALQGPTKHQSMMDGLPCPNLQMVMDRQCPACGGKAKKDWKLFMSNVEKDPPIVPVLELVDTLHYQSHGTFVAGPSYRYDILVVSGRAMDVAGRGTEEWLENHLPGMVTHLFMRNRNDYRDDTIVKQEILDLLPKDRIKYVLDDRDGVVAMWRKNGLTCLQVADGKF